LLAGHSHESRVYNSLGKVPSDSHAWPLFIQTDSATLRGPMNGGRIIQINDSTVLTYDFVPFQ
jgi:hypothetical protein